MMLLFFVVVLLLRPTLCSDQWPFCDGYLYRDGERSKDWTGFKRIVHDVDNMTIPDRFDAREKWPYCKTLSTIVEQGKCGGCWAFSTGMVMSDRLCIATEGKWQGNFSIQDLFDCYGFLNGCRGGSASPTLMDWKKKGVVMSDCKPLAPETLENKLRETCVEECDKGSSETAYDRYMEDKQKVETAIIFAPSEVNNDLRHLQAELMLYGPVTIMLGTYEFYKNYKKGERFDAREKWPYCPSLKTILNQRMCGGCWAYSSAMAMSDRLCIATKGKFTKLLSVQDLLECCLKCLPTVEQAYLGGCEGGYPHKAYEHWMNDGMITGDYGCKPVHEGNQYHKPQAVCRKVCPNNTYPIPYEKDRYFSKDFAVFVPKLLKNDLRHLQAELMLNGPVNAMLLSYKYFYKLKPGAFLIEDVSLQEDNEKSVAHGVRLIGWDVIETTPVWLFINSWGPEWGTDGYGYIRRGKNDCGIETDYSIYAARVDVEHYSTTEATTITKIEPIIGPTTPSTPSIPSEGSLSLGCLLGVFSLVWMVLM